MHRLALGVVLAGLLGGCANLNSIYRYDDVAVGDRLMARTTMIDARQRAVNTQIMHVPVPGAQGAPSLPTGQVPGAPQRHGVDGRGFQQIAHVCTEKSPDAISTLAAALTASGESQGVRLGLGFSSAEQALSIGLRTQLTQAQAELLYRLCEAHGNGAISGFSVQRQLRRFQNTMVALMAIEQLTGATQPGFASVGGSSSADPGDQLARAQQYLDALRADEQAAKQAEDAETEALARLEARIGALPAEIASEADAERKAGLERDLAAARERKPVLETRLRQAGQRATEARDNRLAGEQFRNGLRGGSAGAGSLPAQFAALSRSPEATKAVAEAITRIVETAVTNGQSSAELCHDIIANEYAPSPGTASSAFGGPQHPVRWCQEYLSDAQRLDAQLQTRDLESRAGAAARGGVLPPQAAPGSSPLSPRPSQLRAP